MFNLFKKNSDVSAASEIEILSPMSGKIIDITEVPDPVFSQKMVGDGFAVEPTSGEVLAPVSGTLVQLFPTKHAFGILTQSGLEVLVHVGIDTVDLKGKGFEALAEVGSVVTAGTPILKVDLAVLSENGKSTTTPVVITNMAEVKSLSCVAKDSTQTAAHLAAKAVMK